MNGDKSHFDWLEKQKEKLQNSHVGRGVRTRTKKKKKKKKMMMMIRNFLVNRPKES
jgi:hypothetical protein